MTGEAQTFMIEVKPISTGSQLAALSHEGYAGAVPIIHKSAAVSEVIAQLAVEGDDDPK